MKLNHKSYGQGDALIIIHGFLGMLDNWQAQARMLEDALRVITVDMRNHGHSFHSDTHTYDAMVADVVELMDDLGIAKAHLLGHSMGGKVAMKLAQEFPHRVMKLVVADIAPRYYPVHHDKIFAALNAVPLDSLEKRSDAEPYMAPFVSDFGTRQFLMKSLYHPEQGGWGWRFNLKGLEATLENVGEATDGLGFEGETLFVRGGNSGYISDADWADIKVLFPNARLETMENSGHWLHAEQPQRFSAIVRQFLLNQ